MLRFIGNSGTSLLTLEPYYFLKKSCPFFPLQILCFCKAVIADYCGIILSPKIISLYGTYRNSRRKQNVSGVSCPAFDLRPHSHEGLLILCQFIDHVSELLHCLEICVCNMKAVPVEEQGCFVSLFLRCVFYYMEKFCFLEKAIFLLRKTLFVFEEPENIFCLSPLIELDHKFCYPAKQIQMWALGNCSFLFCSLKECLTGG